MRLHMDEYTFVYRNTSFEGFFFETADTDWWRHFVAENFFTIIPGLGLLYLSGIYFGQKAMKNRPAFKVDRYLTIWNIGLALFSIAYVYRGQDDLQGSIKDYGLHKTVCHRLPISRICSFWGIAFLFSKIFELGDTVFLVLKKKNVPFIHWFHHWSVLQTSFYVFVKLEPVAVFSGLMNSHVHSIMYTYFAIMSSGLVKIPKPIGMAVTSIQILQFLVGLIIMFYAVSMQLFGEHCVLSKETCAYGTVLGTLYLVLFSRMFYNNYRNFKSASKSKVEDVKKEEIIEPERKNTNINYNWGRELKGLRNIVKRTL